MTSRRTLPRPSFLTGVARLLDMGGTFRPSRAPRSQRIQDAEAIRGDWQRVGDSLNIAMRQMDDKLGRAR